MSCSLLIRKHSLAYETVAGTGTEIATLKGNKQPVFCLAITPDRRTLVTGNKDGAARLWNLATGQRQATLKGHEEPVLSVAVTP